MRWFVLVGGVFVFLGATLWFVGRPREQEPKNELPQRARDAGL